MSDVEDSTSADANPTDIAAPEKSPAKTDAQASPPPCQCQAICKVKPKTISALAKDKSFPMPPLSPSSQASPTASPRAPSVNSHRPSPSDQAPFATSSYHGEEQHTTTAAPIAQPICSLLTLRARLLDIADRIGSSLDALLTNYGPIRECFQEIQDQLPKELEDSMSPAMFLEQHQFKL